MSTRSKWISACAAAAALLLGAAVLINRYLQLEPGEATGDPFPIIYTGCCPQQTGEVFDAHGVKVGETAGTTQWQFGQSAAFELYFDVPDDAYGVYFPALQQIEMPGERASRLAGAYGSDSRIYDAARGRRLHVDAHVPETCMMPFPPFWNFKFLRWKVPVTKVDVELAFWSGPRGEAGWTFEGPFESGMTVGLPGSEAAVKVYEYHDLGGDWGTRVELVGFPSKVFGDRIGGRIFGYDLEGRRYSPDHTPGIPRAMFHRLPRERLAAVTVGETPRRRTFHNIKVRRPGGKPLSDRPPVRAAAAVALGIAMDRDSFRNGPKIDSAEDAIKVIDCAFGAIARSVWYPLKRKDGGLDFSQVDAALKRRIIDRVLLWLASDEFNVHRVGLEAASDTGWKEFIPHLFDHLEHDHARGSSTAYMSSAAYALRRMWWQLSPADIERIADYLRANECPHDIVSLFGILEKGAGNSNLREAALAVLVDLAGADKPWLWWRALKSEKALEALGDPAGWPLEMRARRLLVTDFENAKADEAAAARAHEILLSILTSRLMAADSQAFMDVLDRAITRLDPETAMPAMFALLEDMRSCRHAGDLVSFIVTFINREHGVNIAGLGADTSAPIENVWSINWRQIAADALEWRRTGIVPGLWREGYRAAKNDLRIVLKSEGEPEESAIGLWVASDPSSTRRVHTLFVGKELRVLTTIRSEVDPSSKAPTYRVEMVSPNMQGSQHFTHGDLPVTLYHNSGHTWTIEPADSPKSILSGTKVFGEWWEKYAPAEAAP